MKYYAALDDNHSRCHVVASEDDYLPDRPGARLTALCGESLARTHGGPIRSTYHYVMAGRRYSHHCARCTGLHAKAEGL